VTEAGFCSDSGDSGGAVYQPLADATVLAAGLVSGSTGCPDGITAFQPINPVLTEQGLHLVVRQNLPPAP
jgi:hypothetical protein